MVIMGCLWGLGMNIMGCEAEVLGGLLIMGWPWGGKGDGRIIMGCWHKSQL